MLRYTLLPDGTSDRMLLPIIDWELRKLGAVYESQVALLPIAPVEERLPKVQELYPCDLLIVHRDAERESLDSRKQEITTAFQRLGLSQPSACLIPVRMSEAWLLIDESALRRAAGNPNGRVKLNLPPLKKLEAIPDPKALLIDLLRSASELKGRHLKKFQPLVSIHRLSRLIEDFSLLNSLPAYIEFQSQLKTAVEKVRATKAV